MTQELTTPSPKGGAISLSGVRKVYRRRGGEEVIALDGIDLEIPAGTIHGIVGQSGAGKSTIIRCLTALEKPTEGHIVVAGDDMTTLSANELRKARRHIGMVFQHANLLDSRTAAQNIAYPLAIAKVSRGDKHKRVAELLDLVGLTGRGDSYPSELSGGQRQRVGIARALADNPPILLCDEPTSALDTETTAQILRLIREVRDKLGVTVIIITHEMSVVRAICDSVTMLEGGRVIQHGTLEDILQDPNSPLALELVPTPQFDPADLQEDYTHLIDVSFVSHPGKPTGSRVLAFAASIGADVSAGTFETVGTTQVGRIALAVRENEVETALAALQAEGLAATVRRENV